MVVLQQPTDVQAKLAEWRKHKPWAYRRFRAIEHLDTMLVMGGRTEEGRLNDVWKGQWKNHFRGGTFLEWECINEEAKWSKRCDFATIVFKDKGKNGVGRVIIFGGDSGLTDADSSDMGDVWRSDDGGVSWKCSISCALWDARSGHQACLVPSKGVRGGFHRIVMTGGWTAGSDNGVQVEPGRFADVWQCEDSIGKTWSMLPPPPWNARSEHTMVCNEAGVVVLCGGMRSMLGSGLLDDIWTSTDGGYTWQEVQQTGSRFNCRRSWRKIKNKRKIGIKT